jgi:hypothetical protein
MKATSAIGGDDMAGERLAAGPVICNRFGTDRSLKARNPAFAGEL